MMGSSIGGTRSGKEPLRLKICQYKLPKLKKTMKKEDRIFKNFGKRTKGEAFV